MPNYKLQTVKKLYFFIALGASFNLHSQISETPAKLELTKMDTEYIFQLANIHSKIDAKQIGAAIKGIFIQPENKFSAKINFEESTGYFHVISNRPLTETELVQYFSKENLTVTSLTIQNQ